MESTTRPCAHLHRKEHSKQGLVYKRRLLPFENLTPPYPILMPPASILPLPALPSMRWIPSRSPCLKSISCAELNIPEDTVGFVPSKDFKEKLRGSCAYRHNADALTKLLIDETKEYATSRKELVRSALKQQELRVNHALSVIDK
eukprot:IDg22877t1